MTPLLTADQIAAFAAIGLTADMGRSRIPVVEANFGAKETPMKYKTADLSGALLDLAVDRARSVGPTGERDWMHYTPLEWSPSTNWEDGGPIIERERIAVWADAQPIKGFEEWNAGLRLDAATDYEYGPGCTLKAEHHSCGPTPLIAAMRAFVASRLGEEVELP